nr:RNA-directed DNA polymerase, eukaryota, reverse transcriptase zinc-binding domain protein [Tanacetum cinerariifolium]
MADLKFVDQHNMVAYLAKSDNNTEFHQIVDFLSSCSINYALTVSPTIYDSYIEQFWNTASSKTINSVKQIHAIVDGKAVVISESSMRRDLLFDDEDGITCLTNDEIFENLALMGYEQLSTKLTFQKGGGDSVERVITTDASLVVAHDSDNIIKTQTTEMPNVDIPQGIDTGGSPRRQETMGGTPAQTRVTTLENKLSSTNAVYHKAFITLTKKVKKLETQLKQKRSRPVIYSSDKEEPRLDIEDSPKQGRIIGEIDKDENINLRSTTKDKGKSIIQETKFPRKIKKREMIQLSLDEELAQKLHAEELAKETARQEQERYNLEKALELQKQLDQKEEDVDKEEEVKAQADTDQEVEEMKLYMKIVPDEDIAIDAIPLATKPTVIIEYKIVKEGKISTYHIIRADGRTKRYTSMINLLDNIDREDLETIWKLVKDKHGNTRPKEDYERVLWGDIKVMFETGIESEVEDLCSFGLFYSWTKNLKKAREGDETCVLKKLDMAVIIIPYSMKRKKEAFKFANFVADKESFIPNVKKGWKIKLNNSGKLLKELNSTVISLIPKTLNHLKVTDYRPITCCNMVYKCISKVINGRIKKVLGKLVNINQSAFVASRQIQDNILLTQELLKGYDRKEGPSRVDFKIDIQKPYETINWSFLELILTHFGFHEKLIKWIMICVKTTSFTINVNGKLCGFFKGGRGLRQGDPMSPYLFTLVMECFTLMMERNMQRNPNFQFHFGCKSIKITHVCFANDLLVLCHGDVESVKAVRDSIDEFGKFSGKAKIAWKKICKPKSHGGLGMKDLEIWNKALLVKHIWNIACKKDTLWVKWISTVKLNGKNFWEVSVDTNDNWGWKFLLEIRDEISKHVWYKLGDGMKTSLWYDNLCEMGPLCKIISTRSIYSARLTRDMVVVDMVFKRHIHTLHNFLADVMNPDNLLPLAYSFKDRVDPDVNDDTSEDEPTSSKKVVFASYSLQQFSVLVNGITLKKLIRKGISPVLKPKVCLSGAAKKKSIVPDIVNKCKHVRHHLDAITWRQMERKFRNYIPWESRFRRFVDNKLKDKEGMWRSIKKGPYERPMIIDLDDDKEKIFEPLSKMTKSNKKQYIADVKVINYLLQAIPNDIYNLVDACKNAKEMWEHIKTLMFDSDVTNHVRHLQRMYEFDKFAAKEGESLESVYERLTTLVNIMDRNNVRPIPLSINTKFLNLQLEPHVQASKAKRAARNHDPLALVSHSNASSSQSHANPSYLHSPQPYYVSHPSSVVDYEEDYQGELQGNSQEDKFTTAMIVDIQTKNAGYSENGNINTGRQNRNQAFNAGNKTNDSNHIVQRVPRTESNPRKANVQCYNYNEKGHCAHDCLKPRVRDAKDETLEELTVAVIMMVRIQPADDNGVQKLNYDAKAVSEVNASHKMIPKGVHEHKNHGKRKTVIKTFNDDQIDSNIIFDDLYVENNDGSDEHDSTTHDQHHDVKILAYNALREAENKKRLNNELQ